MSDPSRAEWLIERYLDGELSAEERSELNERLGTDPASADLFAKLARLHAALEDQWLEAQAMQRSWELINAVEKQSPRTPRPPALLAAVLAVAAAIAVAVCVWSYRGQRSSGPHHVVAGKVLVEGRSTEKIASGATVEVADRPATLALSDGSTATLEPHSRVAIMGSDEHDRQRVQLWEGSGTFRVSPGERPFTVDTPEGRVTALGTEFTVRVPSSSGVPAMNVRQGLLVIVLSGLVQVEAGNQLVLLTGGEQRAFGEERAERRAKEVRGTLMEHDAALLKLRQGGDNPQEKSFALTKETSVTIDRKPGKLLDLKPGMLLKSQLSSDGSAIMRIEASGPIVFGPVDSVDSQARTISIAKKSKEEGQTPPASKYELASDAEIEIDGQPAKLADLQTKLGASLQLGVDGQTVIAITQRVKVEGEKGRRPDFQTTKGAISVVDPSTRQLTIIRQSEGQQQTSTHTIAKDAAITVDGEARDLKDLVVGQQVIIKSRGEPATAFEVTIGRKKGAEELRKEGQPPRKASEPKQGDT